MMRWASLPAATLYIASAAIMPLHAQAIEPPSVPPGALPVGPVAPLSPTEQKAACGTGTTFPGSQFHTQMGADAMLNYTSAWQFSRGAGQKVAVIDTGVAPNPRLPALQAGGDYVSTSDGLVDCDAHGTLIAGLIAAAPIPDDTFAGVAPDATILSIRQSSIAYSLQGGGDTQNDPNATSPGYGNTQTLALAIVRAVDLGATVINLSEVACSSVGSGLNDAGVGQAVKYAFERNVGRQRAEPVVVRFGITLRPLDQQPLLWRRLAAPSVVMCRAHPTSGKLRGQWRVATVPPCDLLPGVSGKLQSQCLRRHRLMRRVTAQPPAGPAAARSGCRWQRGLTGPPHHRGGQDAGHIG